MEHNSGKFIQQLSGKATYKSFVPSPLPPQPYIDFDTELINLLVSANTELTILETNILKIPDVHLFISMYVRKEALMSSQIEGTQASLEDILDPNIDSNKNQDVTDVINVVKAIEYAIQRLDTLSLSSRLIKECHAILLKDGRGQNKRPGEFRTSQNWVGGSGSTLKNAIYIPPTPQDMAEAISDLDKYIHSNDSLDVLVQATLIHYQFETIHPFLDGNGRVGRLLITLFLIDKNILSSPVLYISYFLKKNRIEYYDRMMEVRHKGNYEQWIAFFLKAFIESAHDANSVIDQLTILHKKNMHLIQTMGRSKITIELIFNYLYSHPMIDISKTAENLNLSFNTVSKAISKLVDAHILKQMEDNNRNRTFVYDAYLELLREGT